MEKRVTFQTEEYILGMLLSCYLHSPYPSLKYQEGVLGIIRKAVSKYPEGSDGWSQESFPRKISVHMRKGGDRYY